MRKPKYDGSDPILAMDFLSRIVEKADMLDMNEEQIYLALLTYLRRTSNVQLCAMYSGSKSRDISCWQE